MHDRTPEYRPDGLTMRSQLVLEPGSGSRAGVLVFPEAFGLDEHAIGRARRLSALGYVALACDLHGGGDVVDSWTQQWRPSNPVRHSPHLPLHVPSIAAGRGAMVR